MTELLAVLVILLMAFLWAGERRSWAEERSAWAEEKKDLLNRVMTKDWPSYVALANMEAGTPPPGEEDQHEDKKTTDYDKAWAI